MKNLYIALAAVAATVITSCTTFDNSIEVEYEQENKENTFTASIESDVETKTTLDKTAGGYNVNWEYKDQIKIYSGNTAVLFETKNTLVKQASFSPVDNAYLPLSDKYTAFYPATLDKDNLTLPAKQTWVRDNIAEFPMFAESNTRELAFHNLCGILQFKLNLKEASDSFAISGITVSAEGKGMSGGFHLDGYTAVVDSKNTSVTLECPNAVKLYYASSTNFNIYLPAGVYSPLKVTIVSSNGIEKNYVSASAITIARSGMTSVNLEISTNTSSDGSTEFITVSDVDVEFSER